jgi:hypothetical protein
MSTISTHTNSLDLLFQARYECIELRFKHTKVPAQIYPSLKIADTLQLPQAVNQLRLFVMVYTACKTAIQLAEVACPLRKYCTREE